ELAAAVRVERSRAGVLRVRGAPAAVEDGVGGDLDQPCAGGGAGPGEVGDRAPVAGGGGRLVGLGGVHGGPGGGVDHHVVPAHRVGERRPVGDVQVRPGGGGDLAVPAGDRDQVPAEHAAGAGDQPAGHGSAAVGAGATGAGPAVAGTPVDTSAWRSRARSGSHQWRWSRYQATVAASPSVRSTRGAYPSSRRARVVSSAYRRSWPLRSGTCTTISQPAPHASSNLPVSSLLVSSAPPPRW